MTFGTTLNKKGTHGRSAKIGVVGLARFQPATICRDWAQTITMQPTKYGLAFAVQKFGHQSLFECLLVSSPVPQALHENKLASLSDQQAPEALRDTATAVSIYIPLLQCCTNASNEIYW